MTKHRKGIVLAGGTGSRLWPLTISVSKQLMPVYDKPMIYYPLSVLMLGGIREILVITTPEDQGNFRRLLGDGSQWGIRISYVPQPAPNGLAEAFILGEDFLDGAPSAMVLGDNIFFGHGLPDLLRSAEARSEGATVFAYRVKDPERYGVVEFGSGGRVASIEEKPPKPKSNFAVTGLYYYDGRAPALARTIKPSARGELEITSLNGIYLEEDRLHVEVMGRGFAWLDTGTHAALLDGAQFVRTLQVRQGLQIGCPEEIAYTMGFIDREMLLAAARRYSSSDYGAYLATLAH